MESTQYTVLYVDDEEINLKVFKSVFRRDFIILTASSAKEGIELLDHNHVDIIITDQRMPEITGVEFLKIVNQKFPNIPPSRLIVSGYSSNSDIKEAFDSYNLYKFVTKPWNAEQFKKTILESIKE